MLVRPVQDRLCQHMVHQSECKQNTDPLVPCLMSEDLKYKITRLSVDCVDIYLVESGSALNIQVPVNYCTCTFKGTVNALQCLFGLSDYGCQWVTGNPELES